MQNLSNVSWAEEQLLVTKVQNKLEHVMDLVSLFLGLKRCGFSPKDINDINIKRQWKPFCI